MTACCLNDLEEEKPDDSSSFLYSVFIMLDDDKLFPPSLANGRYYNDTLRLMSRELTVQIFKKKCRAQCLKIQNFFLSKFNDDLGGGGVKCVFSFQSIKHALNQNCLDIVGTYFPYFSKIQIWCLIVCSINWQNFKRFGTKPNEAKHFFIFFGTR